MTDERLKIYHKNPLIFTIDNILTNNECQLIIDKCKDKMERAQIGVGEKSKVSKIRTGSSYFLKYLDDPELFEIFKKITLLLKRPGRNFDPFFQVIHYNPGEEYKVHIDPSADRMKNENIIHRKFTVLTYLNDVDGGGETEFPNLNLKIEPKQGRIVYFENYNNKEICQDSCHRSLPVIRGEKWAFNLWYHIR
jgi:prolyl 4-hydroxylase